MIIKVCFDLSGGCLVMEGVIIAFLLVVHHNTTGQRIAKSELKQYLCVCTLGIIMLYLNN